MGEAFEGFKLPRPTTDCCPTTPRPMPVNLARQHTKQSPPSRWACLHHFASGEDGKGLGHLSQTKTRKAIDEAT